ncbi:MAG: hypothetical protein M5U09_23435 [Gammaproteobacteria bacterium]|nr:hypothetical protein [Gammaproteobacteria bacterium]
MDRLADDVSTARARHAFEASVPPHIHAACEILLFRDGELAIYVPVGRRASWLRNRQDRIVAAPGRAPRQRRPAAPRWSPPAPPHPRHAPSTNPPRRHPTPPARSRDAAANVTDKKLGNALERLANRLEASARDEP